MLELPYALDGPEREKKHGGTDDHDVFLKRLALYVPFLFHREHERRFKGNEHQDVVQAFYFRDVLVVFLSEVSYVGAKRRQVLGEKPLLFGFVVAGHVSLVRGQGDLRVDDHVFSLGKVNDHVGAKRVAVLSPVGRLGVVFETLSESRHLEGALEHYLPPRSLGLGLSLEGRRQVEGIPAHLLPQGLEVLHVRLERGYLPGRVHVRVGDLPVEILYPLAERSENALHVRLVFFGELFRRVLEDPVSEVLEFVAEGFLRIVENGRFFREPLSFLFHGGVQTGDLGTQ